MESLRAMVLEQWRDALQDVFRCSAAATLEGLGEKRLHKRVAKYLRDVFHPKPPGHSRLDWSRRTPMLIFLFCVIMCMIAWHAQKLTAREFQFQEPSQSLV